jgi:hypothetical protein
MAMTLLAVALARRGEMHAPSLLQQSEAAAHSSQNRF